MVKWRNQKRGRCKLTIALNRKHWKIWDRLTSRSGSKMFFIMLYIFHCAIIYWLYIHGIILIFKCNLIFKFLILYFRFFETSRNHKGWKTVQYCQGFLSSSWTTRKFAHCWPCLRHKGNNYFIALFIYLFICRIETMQNKPVEKNIWNLP